jgi:hypothetical protein
MDFYTLTHTALALGCMGGCYFWGRYLSRAEIVAGVVEAMFDKLEYEGFIRTETTTDGEKELILISDIETKIINEMR